MTALAIFLALSWVAAAWCWWMAWSSTRERDRLQTELDDANDRLNEVRYYAHNYWGNNLADGRAKIAEALEQTP